VRRDRVFAPEEAAANVGGTDDAVNTLAIQSAMQRLPEEQRMAIGLVLVEGLSYKEAAEVMEVPIGTLTSRLARGREALAAMLSESA
jgi:RNA polymerase sigma-70 factor (ECF subfamily)